MLRGDLGTGEPGSELRGSGYGVRDIARRWSISACMVPMRRVVMSSWCSRLSTLLEHSFRSRCSLRTEVADNAAAGVRAVEDLATVNAFYHSSAVFPSVFFLNELGDPRKGGW